MLNNRARFSSTTCARIRSSNCAFIECLSNRRVECSIVFVDVLNPHGHRRCMCSMHVCDAYMHSAFCIRATPIHMSEKVKCRSSYVFYLHFDCQRLVLIFPNPHLVVVMVAIGHETQLQDALHQYFMRSNDDAQQTFRNQFYTLQASSPKPQLPSRKLQVSKSQTSKPRFQTTGAIFTF